MNYRILGKTGILVSELCMGTMSFGGDADEAESKLMFAACRDTGINIFDCADVYANGRSEEILGKCIQDCRNEIILTSKFTYKVGEDVNSLGSSRYHLVQSIENSLRRLATDRVDIYFVHRFDPYTPVEETLRALDDLVHQGKILHIGVSNWAAWQIAKALGISAREHLSRFVCIQPMYNLLKRQVEVEILPLSESEQLGVLTYSPVAAGLLAGKYSKDERPAKGRIISNKQYALRYRLEEYYEIAEKFTEYARKVNVHPVTLAVAWVKHNNAITAPIIGGRNREQLKASLDAAEFIMYEEMYEEITALSINPPNATDRIEELLEPKFQLRE